MRRKRIGQIVLKRHDARKLDALRRPKGILGHGRADGCFPKLDRNAELSKCALNRLKIFFNVSRVCLARALIQKVKRNRNFSQFFTREHLFHRIFRWKDAEWFFRDGRLINFFHRIFFLDIFLFDCFNCFDFVDKLILMKIGSEWPGEMAMQADHAAKRRVEDEENRYQKRGNRDNQRAPESDDGRKPRGKNLSDDSADESVRSFWWLDEKV